MNERAQIPVSPPHPDPLPSYWHNPKSPLANTIEPEVDKASPGVNNSKPPKVYDFTIIGSGISGTLLAYFLLSYITPAPSILMLEARTTCSGATGRNGGHTKAASYRSYLANKKELGKDEALKIVRMEWENIRATHRLARELGLKEKSESLECRTVDVVYDAGEWESGRRAIEELRSNAEEGERREGGVRGMWCMRRVRKTCGNFTSVLRTVIRRWKGKRRLRDFLNMLPVESTRIASPRPSSKYAFKKVSS